MAMFNYFLAMGPFWRLCHRCYHHLLAWGSSETFSADEGRGENKEWIVELWVSHFQPYILSLLLSQIIHMPIPQVYPNPQGALAVNILLFRGEFGLKLEEVTFKIGPEGWAGTSLEEWCSTRDGFAPEEHLAMSRNILVVTTGKRLMGWIDGLVLNAVQKWKKKAAWLEASQWGGAKKDVVMEQRPWSLP